MKSEIMIDIETLALPEYHDAGARLEVTEIAAVRFNASGVLKTCHLFPKQGNGERDVLTYNWWIQQAALTGRLPLWLEKRLADEATAPGPCMEALVDFIYGDEDDEEPLLWCSSKYADFFDLRILETHVIQWADQDFCYPKQRRDMNTLVREADLPRKEKTHNALEDAVQQVETLLEIRQLLKGARS